jgi:putative RNA 2'-phosphotransferase
VLDEQGWADVDELIACAARNGRQLSRELIEEVVATNEKKRFALSRDGSRIRAAQGHSIEVDLGLEPEEPPEILFHGTATRFLPSILAGGLRPGSRQHVHLSLDKATALKVGQRHGKPAVLRIRSRDMWRAGIPFYCSQNGIWLTDRVPPEYLEMLVAQPPTKETP